MSDVRDLLVATAQDVFGRGSEDVAGELEKSGLLAVGEEAALDDVAAVIRVAAYHAVADDFGDRVMPNLGDATLRLGLLRSIQIAGALERVRDLTLAYARQRQQFGQPLNRFQAVQQEIAELAGAVALALAAVEQAVDEPSPLRVGVAKAVAGESAGRAAAIAHQVHGAIGFTDEHQLHRSTTRLWAWRDEGGTEMEWTDALAGKVVSGERGLWEMVTDG